MWRKPLHTVLQLCALCGARSFSVGRFGETGARRCTILSAASRSKATARVPDDMRGKVIILAGATSVGKSSVAMELCEHLNAEIVVADSVQVYKRLDVASNKPSKEDQETVPHHMLDVCDALSPTSTGEFCRRASGIIREIIDRGKVPIVVGGTTLWMQWLLHGVPDAPMADAETVESAKTMLAEFVASKDWAGGLEVLSRYDSRRAATIELNDWYRLHRYLEIALSLRSKSDAVQGNSSLACSAMDAASSVVPLSESGLDVDRAQIDAEIGASTTELSGVRTPLLHGLDVRAFFLTETDRSILYRTIDYRCEKMIQNSMFSEVYQLLVDEVLTPDSPAWRSIGYRQAIEYLCRHPPGALAAEQIMCGAEDTAKAAAASKNAPSELIEQYEAFETFLREFGTSSRNYAKRQIAWFRKDPAFLFVTRKRENLPAQSEPGKGGTSPGKLMSTSHSSRAESPEGKSSSAGKRQRIDMDSSEIFDSISYKSMAEEVLHFASNAVSREEFETQLKRQVAAGKIVSLISGRRRLLPVDFRLQGEDLQQDCEANAMSGCTGIPSTGSSNNSSFSSGSDARRVSLTGDPLRYAVARCVAEGLMPLPEDIVAEAKRQSAARSSGSGAAVVSASDMAECATTESTTELKGPSSSAASSVRREQHIATQRTTAPLIADWIVSLYDKSQGVTPEDFAMRSSTQLWSSDALDVRAPEPARSSIREYKTPLTVSALRPPSSPTAASRDKRGGIESSRLRQSEAQQKHRGASQTLLLKVNDKPVDQQRWGNIIEGVEVLRRALWYGEQRGTAKAFALLINNGAPESATGGKDS